jgi:hypothetical protein
MKIALQFVLFGMLVLGTSCATDDAAKLRAEKPIEVGLLGGMYRPDDNKGFGLAANVEKSIPAPTSFFDTDKNEEKDPEIVQATEFNLFYHHYPWETSAFFVGASAVQRESTFKFDEPRTAGGGDEEIKFTNKSTYVGVPLGWSWIWDNGISLLLDLGPRYKVSEERTFSNDAEDEVSSTSRDDTVNDLEGKYLPKLSIGAAGLIGYSF